MSDIKLSITERVILANQYEILAKLNPDDNEYYQRARDIVRNGYEGFYYDIFDHIDKEVSAEVNDEIHDILTLFERIKASINLLSPEDRDSLPVERLSFSGFDASNDPHYRILNFMIERMDRYNSMKGEYLNTHDGTTIYKYRRMLDVYNNEIKPGQQNRPVKILSKGELDKLAAVAY